MASTPFKHPKTKEGGQGKQTHYTCPATRPALFKMLPQVPHTYPGTQAPVTIKLEFHWKIKIITGHY